MLFLLRRKNLRQDFKEVLTDLLCVIAVGLADEPDGIRQQHMALCFLCFVFLSLLIFFVCDLLHDVYLVKFALNNRILPIFRNPDCRKASVIRKLYYIFSCKQSVIDAVQMRSNHDSLRSRLAYFFYIR